MTYSLYIAAQFYPAFYTLIPTAFILGLGAAPLWIAKCTYLTFIANRLALNEGTDPEPIIVKFFGLFFFLFQCNSILGHSISTFGMPQFYLKLLIDCQHCSVYFKCECKFYS